MRLSFDHLEQRATFCWVPGIWLVCTVEFTRAELEILRNRELAFSVSIGVFHVGHPKDGRPRRITISATEGYIERAQGIRDEHDDSVPLSLKFILSGKPICLFGRTVAEIEAAEALVTRVFSELKAQIEENTRTLSKRTIEL